MAICLEHNQPDPLPLSPLKWERVDYFWDWLQTSLNAFDDYTPYTREELEQFLFSPACRSYEIGDGVGLTTLVFDGVNAYVQMVMLDWKFRDDVCREVCRIAFSEGATRVTSTVSSDRTSARELVRGLGFQYEGRMRRAFERQGRNKLHDPELASQFHDVEIWGLLKEDFENGSNGSNSSSSDSGVDGGLAGKCSDSE